MSNPIVRYVQKQLFAQKGAIANNKAVNFSAAKMAERLSEFGFDPRLIKDEKQLIQALNLIKEAEDKAFAQRFGDMLRPKKSAKVFSLKDKKEIPNPERNIMGGQAFETEEEIAKRIKKDNEKGIANIQKKILEEDREIENLYGGAGFGKDQKVDAEFLAEYLAENAGKIYDDLPIKERLNFYDRAFNALTRYKRTKGTSVIDEPKKLDPRTKEKMDDIKDIEDPEDLATGGRAGFKMGRRAFLKALGAGIGGAAALKTGILKILGKEGTKQAADVAVTSSDKVPPYFLKLAEQIKLLGKQSSGPQERVNVYSMKGKDGKSELMLTEDVGTGEMQIKKIGKENDEMVTEVQTMEYTPGTAQADETTKGKPADQYEEYTEYNSRIQKDEFNDPIVEDGINAEDISKEIKDKFDVEQEILEEVARDKKASGGIAMMLGQ
jgi:hypothetical protein